MTSYKKLYFDEVAKNDKFNITLGEVKQFANDLIKDICNHCGFNGTDNCDSDCIPYDIKTNIVQKIDEVRNANT